MAKKRRKKVVNETAGSFSLSPVVMGTSVAQSKQWHQLVQDEKIERIREVVKQIRREVQEMENRNYEDKFGVYF